MRHGTVPTAADLAASGPQAEENRLLVADEVARLLSVPVSWVREATRAGRLPHVRLGRYVRYERAALTAWLGDQRARA